MKIEMSYESNHWAERLDREYCVRVLVEATVSVTADHEIFINSIDSVTEYSEGLEIEKTPEMLAEVEAELDHYVDIAQDSIFQQWNEWKAGDEDQGGDR